MKAIFEDRTRQYTVQVGDVLAIDKMDNIENDQKVEFNQVLLYTDEKNETKWGAPFLEKGLVTAKVIESYTRDKKVIVFKYKRKKNYKRLKGHKQPYTIIKIENIQA